MLQTASTAFESKYWHRIRQVTYVLLAAAAVVLAGFLWTGPILSIAQQVISALTNEPPSDSPLAAALPAEAGPAKSVSDRRTQADADAQRCAFWFAIFPL